MEDEVERASDGDLESDLVLVIGTTWYSDAVWSVSSLKESGRDEQVFRFISHHRVAYNPRMFQPRPGRQERSGRSPRTSGAPFLARMDSGHAERKPPQICPGRVCNHDQIAGSADISFLICHLREGEC